MARVLRQANEELNFEPSSLGYGLWQFPTNLELCCIYRVPNRLRKVNPSAYTPQLLIIGPLHYSLKIHALEHLDDIDNTKFIGYLSMEQHKKIYLSAFAQRFDEEDIIDGFKSVIEEEEEAIRASYSESTAWIESKDFVKMILRDSVFILEFILRYFQKGMSIENTGDILMDQVSLNTTVCEDLMLLENQLPFFILQKLFDPIIKTLYEDETLTFRKVIIQYFGVEGKMNDDLQFKHFTDFSRCVRLHSLNLEEGGEGDVNGVQRYKAIEFMYNAEKLHNAGIKFKVIEEKLSLDVKFENGCLELPTLVVQDGTEAILRNLMALEQCHYPYKACICSYIFFLDYLIDTVKDVDFLVEKGIIENWMGDHSFVADMVNKLSLGIVDCGSYYYDIACRIKAHYINPEVRSRAVLRRVYLKNPWTVTATIAATFVLLMALGISDGNLRILLLKLFDF